MISHILLAVNDSPAALAAARLSILLACAVRGEVRAVNVIADGELTAVLVGAAQGDVDEAERRRGAAGEALLRHVTGMGEHAGLAIQTRQVRGEPASRILAEAREWPAHMIVMGRSDMPGPYQRRVGEEALRVLEFADLPVLVVPPPAGVDGCRR